MLSDVLLADLERWVERFKEPDNEYLVTLLDVEVREEDGEVVLMVRALEGKKGDFEPSTKARELYDCFKEGQFDRRDK